MENYTLPPAGTVFGLNVIYGLSCSCDPNHIRYVGLTTRGAEWRLAGHLHEALVQPNGRGRNPKHRWIRSHLSRQGDHQIQTRTLGEYPKEELGAWEQHWISILFEDGHELLNADAQNRWTAFSEETRTKMSAAHKRRLADPAARAERVARLLEANKRRLEDPDARAEHSVKISEANRRRWADPDVRAEHSVKISESHKRRRADPAAHAAFSAKMSESLKRYSADNPDDVAARIAKMLEVNKRRLEDPVARAGLSAKQSESQRRRFEDPLERAKMTSVSKIGNHTRWHTDRGIVNPECEFCTATQVSLTAGA